MIDFTILKLFQTETLGIYVGFVTSISPRHWWVARENVTMLANSTVVRRIKIAWIRLQAIYPRLSTFIWISILNTFLKYESIKYKIILFFVYYLSCNAILVGILLLTAIWFSPKKKFGNYVSTSSIIRYILSCQLGLCMNDTQVSFFTHNVAHNWTNNHGFWNLPISLRVATAPAQHAGWTVFGHETLFGVVLSYS
jgi:hypothetical protein